MFPCCLSVPHEKSNFLKMSEKKAADLREMTSSSHQFKLNPVDVRNILRGIKAILSPFPFSTSPHLPFFFLETRGQNEHKEAERRTRIKKQNA